MQDTPRVGRRSLGLGQQSMETAFPDQRVSTGRLQAWLAAQHARNPVAPDASRPVRYAWDREQACLLVDCTGLLGWESLHAISDWASGFLTVRCNERLIEDDCITDLGLPFGPAHPDSAFRQWFATIPSALIAPLTPLPSRQYALAHLAQRSQSVHDLILSHVNLCYLLHYVATEHGDPEQRITEMLRPGRLRSCASSGCRRISASSS